MKIKYTKHGLVIWVVTYVLLAGLSITHLLIRPLGDWASFIPFVLELSVAAVFTLAAWRSSRIEPAAGKPWSWFGLAMIVFSAVEIMGLSGFAIYLDPSVIVGYLIFYISFFKGLRSFGKPSLSVPQKSRLMLDITIISVASLAILQSVYAGASKENFWVLAYGMGDIFLLWALLAVIFDPRYSGRMSIRMLVPAVIVLIISDFLYASQAILNRGVFYALNTIGFNTSFLLMGLAGWLQITKSSKSEQPEANQQARYRPLSQIFAFFFFWVSFFVLMGQAIFSSWTNLVYLGVLLLLSVIRLRFNQLDMIRTLHQFQEATSMLETRVQERTRELEKVNERLRTEIDQRVRTTGALIHSEQRFRALTELTAEGVLVLQESRVVDANSSVSRISGYGLDELKSMHPSELLAVHVRDPITEELTRGWSGSKELEGLHRNGRPLMMEWRCQDSVWNNKPAKVILIRDVSDHKQAALERSVETERIRTQESTLLQILKSPEFPSVKQAVEFIAELVSSCLMVERVSIWFLDDDRASLRCETLYRRSVRKHDEEAALHAGEFPRYFEALQNLRVINADDAASDPRTSEFASGYLERNHIGSMMDAGVRVQGVLRGVLCCEHTEGVRNWHADEMTFAGQVADQIAQVLLKRQEKTLQERLTQMERMETVGNLAGGIAHDFNNLLTPIMGYADLVYQELPAESALRKDLLAIQSAAERAKSLARQLLMFSRKSVAEMKVHDLRAIITDFLKILRRTVREDIIIDYRSGLELMPVVCDVSQMEQILMNLAVNAQDAMPKGGKMIIELARIHLEETAGSSRPGIGSGEFVELKFGDTGRGMDSFIQKRIFEPFFTTKEMGKGTGLGLATVYGIVRQHRGHIELHSEVDKGTTFTVFFPVAANQKTATRHESKQAGDDQGWESVCVVEDDEMVRQLTVKALQQKGYTTFSYESPHACLQDFESGEISFALLLSDVIMPGMSGKELYEILHARKPDLKVIYMSGYSDNVISAHDLLDSDAHFLQKPFTLDILAASVRNALGH